MPRVNTAVARKDYPEAGIKKGDKYYHWQFYTGPVQRSATYPKPSQLTGSEKKANALRAYEDLQDAVAAATAPEDVKSALEQAAQDAQGAIDEYDESISNLEDAFPNGCPNLDTANEERDAIQEFLDACESAANEVESLDYMDYEIRTEVDQSKGVAWDDLTEDGQAAMLEAACELASDCDLSI